VQDVTVVVGALTRQRTSELSDVVTEMIPLLAEAGKHVAHVSVRERGTVVGSVTFADPSAELPAALLALDGQVVAMGPAGRRVIDADDFFVGPWQNALTDVELATEIRIPKPATGHTGSAFLEVSRRQGELPVCGVATIVTLGSDGTIEDARVALCAVHQRPVRARTAERRLVGRTPSPEVIQEAAEETGAHLDPIADCHGSADFRRHLARVLTRRSLQTAFTRILPSDKETAQA